MLIGQPCENEHQHPAHEWVGDDDVNYLCLGDGWSDGTGRHLRLVR